MKVFFKEFTISTSERFQVINITSYVEEAVKESGIRNGICLVFVPHATAAIIANEYEPNIVSDYIELIRQVFKPDYEWKHNRIDNNAHAHLASAVIGPSRILSLIHI